MIEYYLRDLQAASDILLEAARWSNYWADMRYEGDALVVREREPDDEDSAREWWIYPAHVLAFLDSDGPSELVKQLGDPYQQAAVAMLKMRNWDEVDYDCETADAILQQMILDMVKYG